jgi:hypothetical protein
VTRVSPYLSVQADYKVGLTIINGIPANGYIRIIIPLDQADVPTNGPICKTDVSMTTLATRVFYRTESEAWIDIG